MPESIETASAIDACSDATVVFGTGMREHKRIYKSSHSSSTWEEMQIGDDTSRFITDISIIDQDHIWVVTAYPAQILATTDAGETWTVQYYEPLETNFFDYIEMFSSTHGIAMADGLWIGPDFPARFLRTTDGGDSWTSINDTLGSHSGGHLWACIDFVNIHNGFWKPTGCPEEQQKVHKTFTGGNSWLLCDPGVGVQLLKFFDTNIGLTAYHDFVCLTIDGGETWTTHPKPEAYSIDIEFSPSDPALVWLLNGESLLFSSDTGRTWEIQMNGLLAPTDMVFSSSSTGWLLDLNGVYHTSSGGVVGVDPIPRPSTRSKEEHRIYPNPMNDNTSIEFRLNQSATVILQVIDIRGTSLYRMNFGQLNSGFHSINMMDMNSSIGELSSGVYIVSIITPSKISSTKMVVVK